MKISIRHFLSSHDTKLLEQKLKETYKVSLTNLFEQRVRVELAKTKTLAFYFIEGKPLLFETNGLLLPTLLFVYLLTRLPKVVVDMGAVPYICNGADVMAPGIVRIDGDFDKDSIVLIVDCRYGKSLAIGRALFNSDSIVQMKKGKAIKNMHYVGDKIWKLIKKFM